METVTPLYALPCGHLLCEADMKSLGFESELATTDYREWLYSSIRLLIDTVWRSLLATRTLLHIAIFYFAITDPGAPIQAIHDVLSMMSGALLWLLLALLSLWLAASLRGCCCCPRLPVLLLS